MSTCSACLSPLLPLLFCLCHAHVSGIAAWLPPNLCSESSRRPRIMLSALRPRQSHRCHYPVLFRWRCRSACNSKHSMARLPASLCLSICRRFACLPVCLLPRMWSSMHMHTLPRAYTIAPACPPLSRLLVPWSSVLPPAQVGAVLNVTVTCGPIPPGHSWVKPGSRSL